MKLFYKIFILSIGLYLGSAPAASAGVVVWDSDEASSQKKLARKVEQKLSAQDTSFTHFGRHISAKGCPLYASVRAGLEEYYGKNEFADAGRQSGWYRVEIFLKWLKRNEAVLKKENIVIDSYGKKYTVPVCRALRKASYQETFTPQDMQGILGVWLGARYTADMFVNGRSVQFPDMMLSTASAGRAVIDSNGKQTSGRIEIHPDSYALVPALNLGLHEGTHLAGWMTGRKNSLGEWGTYLATVHFALPVKAPAGGHTYQGARSFTHNAAVKTVPCEQIFSEYAAFVLGARMYPAVRRQDFFAFEQQLGGYRDGTLLMLLRNLAALQKGQFYLQDVFLSSGGTEEKVLSHLKRKFPDCPAVQETSRLEDGMVLSCGNTTVEIIQDFIDWIAVAGRKGTRQDLARAVAPVQLSGAVAEELQALSDFLAPQLEQMPLKDISWNSSVIKDYKQFKDSAPYNQLCRQVRQYARDNPSGVPPVPAGYM